MKDLCTYYIKTYGCSMNYADSSRVRNILNGVGLKEVEDFKKADVIILNSCSVRKQAEDKIVGWSVKLKGFNKDEKTVVLTGCMAVRKDRKKTGKKKYVDGIKRKNSWIDYVLDIQDITRLPELLGVGKIDDAKDLYLNIIPEKESEFIANVPISTGCNFFCSYCIVPFSRGELLHRDYQEIINEVEFHLERGIKIICLVAQNVNSWKGFKNDKKIDFADLLQDVANLPYDFWINFVSSNPMDFSNKMIDVIGKNKSIMRGVNIAVQSGSNNILEKMNRRYSIEEFEELVKNIKRKVPDIRLTTDIIVGFPDESEEDFEKTLELIQKVQFQMLYVGKYSPREGTASANLEDDVDIEEKKRRENVLKKELNKYREKFHGEFVGKELDVLVVGGRKAISYYYHEVLLEETVKEERIGSFLKVYVTKATLSGLIAKC